MLTLKASVTTPTGEKKVTFIKPTKSRVGPGLGQRSDADQLNGISVSTPPRDQTVCLALLPPRLEKRILCHKTCHRQRRIRIRTRTQVFLLVSLLSIDKTGLIREERTPAQVSRGRATHRRATHRRATPVCSAHPLNPRQLLPITFLGRNLSL